MRNPPNQEPQHEAEAQAAATPSPAPLANVWSPTPDIQVGPYSVRPFVDGDFKRLAQLGHPLNSFNAIGKWLDEPNPSGPDAWLLNWIMTRPVHEVKEGMTAGPEAVREAAEAEFSKLNGMQLAFIMRAAVNQLSVYMGAKPVSEPKATAGEPGR